MLELIKSFVMSVKSPTFDVVKSNAEILVLRDHETGKKSVVNSYPAASKSTLFSFYSCACICVCLIIVPHSSISLVFHISALRGSGGE